MIGSPRSVSILGAAYRPVDTAHRGGAGNEPRGKLAAPTMGAILALPLLLVAAGRAAGAGEKLPQRHKEWLAKDVGYIISKEEKDAFLRLTRDEDRDNFIQQFWAISSPNPSSPVNEFKQEHYRRIPPPKPSLKSEWEPKACKPHRARFISILGHRGAGRISPGGGKTLPITFVYISTHVPW